MKIKLKITILLVGVVLIFFKFADASIGFEEEAKNLNKAPLAPHLYLEDGFNKNYTEVGKPSGYQKLEGVKENPGNCIQINTRLFCDFNRVAFGTIAIKNTSKQKNIVIKLGERAQNDQVWFPDKNTIDIKNIEFYKTNLLIKSGESLMLEVPSRYRPKQEELPKGVKGVIPFRYVEIESLDGVEGIEVERIKVHYPYDPKNSFFQSSNEDLNKLWDLSKYTLLETTYAGLFVDGNRERKPYEADAFINQQGYFAVEGDPNVGRYTINFLRENPTWPTEWLLLFISMVYEDYMQTGDVSIVRDNYEAMKLRLLSDLRDQNGFINTKDKKRNNLLINKIKSKQGIIADVVDWPPSERDGYAMEAVDPATFTELAIKKDIRLAKAEAADKMGLLSAARQYRNEAEVLERSMYEMPKYNSVVNMYLYDALVKMSLMALDLKSQDFEIFKEDAIKLKSNINKNMFDLSRGIYIDGIGANHASLHANMYALAFDLVPAEYRQSVLNYVKTKDMSCSVYGANFLLDGLYKNQEGEYATQLLLSSSPRSWLNIFNSGATMTFESWNEEINPEMDLNHAWAASPAHIILSGLLGIKPILPKWKEFDIRPWIIGFDNLEIKFPVNKGAGKFSVNKKKSSIDFEISIPKNTLGNFYASNLNQINLEYEIDGIIKKMVGKNNPIMLTSGYHKLRFFINEPKN